MSTSNSSALADKHVVVIGGTSGIGLAVAEAGRAADAKVTVASRNPQRTVLPGHGATEQVDLTSTDSIDALFERLDGFDHLVLSAGPGAVGSVRDLPSAAARPYMDTKFWGYYDAIRAASSRIAQDGSITLIGGGASRKHAPGRPMMAAINPALEAFGKANAVDLAPVRVNVIAPGLIDTSPTTASPRTLARACSTAKQAASRSAARVVPRTWLRQRCS